MKTLADYEIVDELGIANFGTLYLARPPPRLGIDSDTVVLKMLHQRASDYEFRRLSNELRLHASLHSPYLVEVLDAGIGEGVMFYTMRHYVDGSLEKPTNPLTPGSVVQIVADAARGAHAMHEIGVAHRDIKPTSILIKSGRGRLSDLGLAQIAPGLEASSVAPVGTLEYLAPEIAAIGPATRASDIWSLGVTLHAALSSHELYPDMPRSGLVAALRHIRGTPPRIDGDLPSAVRVCLFECLSTEPTDRPSTAELVADQLDAIVGADERGST